MTTTFVKENSVKECMKQFYESNNLPQVIEQYDNNFENLECKIIKWLDQFKEEHRSLFLHLFTHLKYFDYTNITKWYREAYEKFKSIEPAYMDSIFTPITSIGGIMNGAVYILANFDNAGLNISRKRIAAQPVDFNNSFKINEVQNIVLLDDIVGSGDTVMDFVINCLDNKNTVDLFSNKKIYIFSIAVTDKAKNRVIRDLKFLGFEAEIISKCIIDKALGPGVIFTNEKDRLKALKIVRNYEKEVALETIYEMGYKGSQSLISFYFNTPNNTLSTFWVSNKEKPWSSVFPRREDIKEFELGLEESIKLQKIKGERQRVRTVAENLEKARQAEIRKRIEEKE